MKRRKWDLKTKARVVLEGLKGRPIAELWTEHQVSQSQYCACRDHFACNAAKTFMSISEVRAKRALKCSSASLRWRPKKAKRRSNEPASIAKNDRARSRRSLNGSGQLSKVEHPSFWGYRQVWAHLRYAGDQRVNKPPDA